ncbi:MAG: MBL fold metallo-hydrolase [Terriglobia bacterium]
MRGSTPTPNREFLRTGGNTPCLELRTADGGLFVLDCGTGLRQLGKALVKEFGENPIHARIFLSHFHWDHIQGIPFFAPLYHERNQFFFHGYQLQDASVRRALEGQMNNPYFPVDMSTMRAHRHFFAFTEERTEYDELVLISRRLQHPQGCLGYRMECRGKVVVYASDNEPGTRQGDENVRRLADGADVLIYDAQYTPLEMKYKRKWGHSTWKEGVRIAKECKVKKLILFHHDPERDDKAVSRIVKRAQDHFDDVVAAREGMVVAL